MVQKTNQKQTHPHVLDFSNLPHDNCDKDTLFARPLLTPLTQKLCRCKHGILQEEEVSDIISR
jgi:hypothetical protein